MAIELQAPTSELGRVLHLLWRRRLVLAGATLVVGLVGFLFSSLQPNRYQASAELQLEPAIPDSLLVGSPGSTSRSTSDVQVQTELRYLQSNDVRKAAEDRLGFKPDVSFEPIPSTDVVTITSTADTGAHAADAVNTYSDAYIEVRRTAITSELDRASKSLQATRDQLNSQLSALVQPLNDLDTAIASSVDSSVRSRLDAQRAALNQSIDAQRQSLVSRLSNTDSQLNNLSLTNSFYLESGAHVITPADVPSGRTSPNPTRDTAIALVIGLVLGLGLAFLFDRLDDSVLTEEDTARATSVPVLATIPMYQGRSADRPLLITHPHGASSEGFRTLRTALQILQTERPGRFSALGREPYSTESGAVGLRPDSMRLIEITSPTAGDGKTTTVVNLGLAFAQSGQSTLIVSADMRRPTAHAILGLSNAVGLSTVLAGDASLDRAIQRVHDSETLHVLASGATPYDAAELASGVGMRTLFEELASRYDVVLIDTPPVLAVSDALALSRMADAVVIVAHAGRTSRRNLERSMIMLEQVDAPVIGTVLNFAGRQAAGYSSGYDYTDSGRSLAFRPTSLMSDPPSFGTANGAVNAERQTTSPPTESSQTRESPSDISRERTLARIRKLF